MPALVPASRSPLPLLPVGLLTFTTPALVLASWLPLPALPVPLLRLSAPALVEATPLSPEPVLPVLLPLSTLALVDAMPLSPEPVLPVLVPGAFNALTLVDASAVVARRVAGVGAGRVERADVRRGGAAARVAVAGLGAGRVERLSGGGDDRRARAVAGLRRDVGRRIGRIGAADDHLGLRIGIDLGGDALVAADVDGSERAANSGATFFTAACAFTLSRPARAMAFSLLLLRPLAAAAEPLFTP